MNKEKICNSMRGRRDRSRRKQLLLNYYELLLVHILVFIVFSSNDMASESAHELTFRFLSSLRVLLKAKSADNKRRYRLSHTADYSIFAARETYTLPLKLVSTCAREDVSARISLVLPEFRQSKATSAARIMSTIANSLKVALWRTPEKMSYRLNLNILISQRRAPYM